jgi:hypothetical protein
MKPGKKSWRPSPAIIAVTTALMVIAGTMLIGWLNARRYRVNARVEIADPIAATAPFTAPASVNPASLPDGEVARLATRIREATGLLMGLALLAVTEQMSDRSLANVDALIERMAERNLLPPGIGRISISGTLGSDHAILHIRYRPLPFGIEVVSVGREPLDGPAVIARLTATGDDTSGAVLLVAKKRNGGPIPPAFAPLSELATLNWSIEPLRERLFAPEEIGQLNQWARQYATTGQ